MIDLALYRCRIGLFCGCGVGRLGGKSKDRGKDQYHKPYVFSPTNRPQSTKFNLFNKSTMEPEENIVHNTTYFMHTKFYMLLYLYMILIFTLITLSIVCLPDFMISLNIYPGVVYLKWDLSFITLSQIKIAYFYLIFYVILRSIYTRKNGRKI